MIDFGLVALFAFQAAMVVAVVFVALHLVQKIAELKELKTSITGVTPRLESFRADIDKSVADLVARQNIVEATPKKLQARIDEVADQADKVQRQMEGNESRFLSLQGRVNAFSGQLKKALAGGDDDDETGPAAKAGDEGAEIRAASLGPQNEERPALSVIPRGFGKVARRAS